MIVASLKTIFVDRAENVLTLLKLANQFSTLKRIVLTKKLPTDKDNEIRKKANELGIEVMTYSQLIVRFEKALLFFFLNNRYLSIKELGRTKPVPHHVGIQKQTSE